MASCRPLEAIKHLKDDQREFAETIHDSGRTLVVIVNDILDLARLQAGQVEFENIP